MHGVSQIIVINCESILGYVHKKRRREGDIAVVKEL